MWLSLLGLFKKLQNKMHTNKPIILSPMFSDYLIKCINYIILIQFNFYNDEIRYLNIHWIGTDNILNLITLGQRKGIDRHFQYV